MNMRRAALVRSLLLPLGVCLPLWSQEKPVEKAAEPPHEDTAEVLVRQPSIRFVFPLSGRPGRTVELTARGEFLDGARRVEFETSDVTGTVLNATYTGAKIRVQIAANAEPGPRYFRLFSPRGATNLMLLRLTRTPRPTPAR